MHIADGAGSVLCRRIGNAVRADVDDDRTRLNHLTRDAPGLPHRGDEDVGRAGVPGNIFGGCMHDRDDRISALLFLHQEIGDRFPDYIAPAHDYDMFSGGIVAAPEKEFLDPERGARFETGLPGDEAADIDRMEPIDILPEVDGIEDDRLVDV